LHRRPGRGGPRTGPRRGRPRARRPRRLGPPAPLPRPRPARAPRLPLLPPPPRRGQHHHPGPDPPRRRLLPPPRRGPGARPRRPSRTPVIVVHRTAFAAGGLPVEVTEVVPDAAAYVLQSDFDA